MAEYWDMMLMGALFPFSVVRRWRVAEFIAVNDFNRLRDMSRACCPGTWAQAEEMRPEELAFIRNVVIPKATARRVIGLSFSRSCALACCRADRPRRKGVKLILRWGDEVVSIGFTRVRCSFLLRSG